MRCISTDLILWLVNILVAALATINAIAWGYCVREVGEPQLSLEFMFRLAFNKWFVLAMLSALASALLSYVILRRMGVLVGRFFLSLGYISTILACVFVLRERVSPLQWIGVLLIFVGVLLVGR